MKLVVFIFILKVTISCKFGRKTSPDASSSSIQTKAAASANTEFAVEMLQKVSNGKESVFFSAYSISAALAMTSLGAGGETLKQIDSTFHFDDINKNGGKMSIHKVYKILITTYNKPNINYTLSTANRLYGDENFQINTKFQENCKNYYLAELQLVNFGSGKAEGIINSWVEQQTHDKIKNIFPEQSFDSQTKLVLVNAIYFKGTWLKKFKDTNTKKEDFFTLGGQKKTVDMMNEDDYYNFKQDSTLKVKVLELAYAGNDLSMFAILPDTNDGITDLINDLTGSKLAQLLTGLTAEKVIIKIPKFKLETDYSLSGTLSQLGIKDLSTDKADLQGMGTPNPQVSAIAHKAFVEVDEEGTEAAAATGVVAGTTSVEVNPLTFTADHPFLFVIVDKRTNFHLFTGVLLSP